MLKIIIFSLLSFFLISCSSQKGGNAQHSSSSQTALYANVVLADTSYSSSSDVTQNSSSSLSYLLGDLDGDAQITWADINRVYWYFGEKGEDSYNEKADIDTNGVVDANDAELLKAILYESSSSIQSEASSSVEVVTSAQSSSSSVSTFIEVDYNLTKAYSFIVFGDLNGGGCEKLSRVNEAVTMMVEEENIDFFVSTGDIIDGYIEPNVSGNSVACFGRNPFEYDLGVSTCNNGVDDGNMHTILAPINERSVLEGLTSSLYITLGDHDDNWKSGFYPDPCGGGICDILAPREPSDFLGASVDNAKICSLDTNNSTYPKNFYYAFNYQDSEFIFLRLESEKENLFACTKGDEKACELLCADPSKEQERIDDNYAICYNAKQYDWLRHKLESAKANSAKHIFVFAHTPLVSHGKVHSLAKQASTLQSLLETFDTEIYFNGHHHAYERSYPLKNSQADENGTRYITVGSTGGVPDKIEVNSLIEVSAQNFVSPDDEEYKRKMTTYLRVDINASHVNVRLKSIGLEGAVVDSFSYRND